MQRTPGVEAHIPRNHKPQEEDRAHTVCCNATAGYVCVANPLTGRLILAGEEMPGADMRASKVAQQKTRLQTLDGLARSWWLAKENLEE